MRRSRALGSSVEFSDFREYVPGDDIRRVDWNAYARFDRLYLKLFMEEQETTLFVLLDASASMAGGGKWEAARAIAEALCYLALRAGDRVCFACLRGAETLESPLFAGRAAYEKASAFLDGVHPAGRTRLGERGAAVRPRGARGMAVVLSDLFSEDDWTRCPTRLLYARRQTALVHILAREELEPDVSGAVRLVDSETGEKIDLLAGGEAHARLPPRAGRIPRPLAGLVPQARRALCAGGRGRGSARRAARPAHARGDDPQSGITVCALANVFCEKR